MNAQPAWDEQRNDFWKSWWRSTPKDEFVHSFFMPMQGTPISDAAAAMIAAAAAYRGTGYVSPNPLVGCCVVSKDGQFLNAGAHQKVGTDHAEVDAFRAVAPKDVQGARVFVTLEPCAHFGKTPPCADFLAKMPVSEVCYLVSDPDPRVNGAGAARIASAGIQVQKLDQWSEVGEEVAEIFLMNQRQKRPFVGVKIASTADGVYAIAGSSRYWITGERSREYGHFLRMVYDGILVGAKTVIQDNPTLNVRHSKFTGRTPWRFVMDPGGRALNLKSQLNLWFDADERTIWFVGPGVGISAMEFKHQSLAKLVTLPTNDEGFFEWHDILKSVWDLGCKSVLIEGGGEVWRGAFKSGIVDKLHWFVAADRSELAGGLKWDVSLPICQGQVPRFMLDEDKYFEISCRGESR